MSTNYYLAEESVSFPGKYLIKLNFSHPNLPTMVTSGSYNVLMARLLNLSYANFLRLCRDHYGAEIIGKNCRYPLPFFEKGEAEKLIKVLNERMGYLISVRNGKPTSFPRSDYLNDI